jgi:hypothetical protein
VILQVRASCNSFIPAAPLESGACTTHLDIKLNLKKIRYYLLELTDFPVKLVLILQKNKQFRNYIG